LSVDAKRLALAIHLTARRTGKSRVEVVFDGSQLRIQDCDNDPNAIDVPYKPRRVKHED